MNSIAAHVEFLLRTHDCVVLPGIGAFLCNYVAARFDADESSILPPGRSLVFNGMITDSDGLLATSLSRKEGITYEAAAMKVRDEMELLRRQIDMYGDIQLGRLGVISKGAEGQFSFEAAALSSVNGAFFGLSPLHVTPLEQERADSAASASACIAAPEQTRVAAPARYNLRPYAVGIAASLAILVTCMLFMFSPVKTSHHAETASMAPVPSMTADNTADDVETVVAAEEPAVTCGDASATTAEDAAVGSAVPETVKPEVSSEANAATSIADVNADTDKPSDTVVRFNSDDAYCVIVASFPTRGQADTYVRGHAAGRYGILEKDNKFRVYAATGATYAGANAQKQLVGQSDAWICRR